MTHHRPKSPSPTQLPAIEVPPPAPGDTVVELAPVADAAKHVDLTAPPPELLARDITSPMEIPHELKVPSLNATTPGTPLSLAAPALAKINHAELHKAQSDAPPALGAAPPLTTPIDPAMALGPTFEPMPAAEPVKKRESGPRRSHPDLPAPRKSRTDAPAITDTPTGPSQKSRPDAPAITDVPTGPPRKSLTELPAQVPAGKKPTHDALPKAPSNPSHTVDAPPPEWDAMTMPLPSPATLDQVRKSREHPRAKSPGSGERPPVKREGAVTAPLPSPVPDIALSEPLPTPKMMQSIDVLERPTSPNTLPQVPPVLPFGGMQDPRFKRGAMAIGVLCAVVLMALVSWELLKAQPEMPPEDALKPAYVELPAPPRKDEDELPKAQPVKPMQVEVSTDAGTQLVAAGTLNVWCDPDANVFLDGRDLGPTPTHSVVPAGKATFSLVNVKLGLHKLETVEVKPGENKNVTYHFSPGFLEVVADEDARLTVDGKPITNRTMQVYEGNHRVEATYGHDKVSRSAEVLAGETTTIEVRP